MKRVSTKKPTELLSTLWRTSTTSQKKALLKARMLNQSWAKTKTINEMVKRGGGMVANDLLYVVKEHHKRNPQIKEVRFELKRRLKK